VRNKDSRLWAYDAVLLVVCAGIGALLPWPATPWPPLSAVVVFVLLQLVVWQYNFTAPGLGMLSMERMPQVAALCLLPMPQAALLISLPALLFPFVNRRYRQDSLAVGLQRGVHNTCMIFLMGVGAGAVYAALGGPLPLRRIDGVALVALIGQALALQAINNAMIVGYYALEGRDTRRLLNARYLLLDLCFVPFGALLALITANAGRDVLALFLALVVLIVLSLHSLNVSRGAMQARLDNLDASRLRDANGESRRLDAVLEGLIRRIQTLFRFNVAYIALHDPVRNEFDLRIEQLGAERRPPSFRPLDVGLAGLVFATGEPLLIEDWETAPADLRTRAVVAPGEKPGSLLVVPLRLDERMIGIVSIQHEERRFYSEADRHALQALAGDSAALIADAQTFDELTDYRTHLEELVAARTAALEASLARNDALLAEVQAKGELLARQSREDVLTGVANRRHFDERLAAEIERALRYGHPLCLLLIDLDHFKRVNDSAGHAAGDEVLKVAAATMAAQARTTDFLARIGGEEFALVLPEQSSDRAEIVAEHVRSALARVDYGAIAPGQRVTASIGIAALREGEDRDSLMRRADAALYGAKNAGRDRVVVGAA
jgi:diguanylate cyclase (GGDEF)-like protein